MTVHKRCYEHHVYLPRSGDVEGDILLIVIGSLLIRNTRPNCNTELHRLKPYSLTYNFVEISGVIQEFDLCTVHWSCRLETTGSETANDVEGPIIYRRV